MNEDGASHIRYRQMPLESGSDPRQGGDYNRYSEKMLTADAACKHDTTTT
jgi:hypothetical protein